MSHIEVKPKEGLYVPHPESGNPIRDGQTVARTPGIIRLLKCGDLELVVKKKKAPAKKKESN